MYKIISQLAEVTQSKFWTLVIFIYLIYKKNIYIFFKIQKNLDIVDAKKKAK